VRFCADRSRPTPASPAPATPCAVGSRHACAADSPGVRRHQQGQRPLLLRLAPPVRLLASSPGSSPSSDWAKELFEEIPI